MFCKVKHLFLGMRPSEDCYGADDRAVMAYQGRDVIKGIPGRGEDVNASAISANKKRRCTIFYDNF